MYTAVLLLKQIALMFVYIGIGFIMTRKGLLTKEGSQNFGNLLLYVILPCAILKSFCIDMSDEAVRQVFISFGGAVLVLICSCVISALFFRKDNIGNLGSAFSNAGFIGIPLIGAVMGEEHVVYVAAMVGLINALQWTYGQMVMTGDKSNMSVKKIFTGPVILAFLGGVLLLIFKVRVPAAAVNVLGSISVLTAPISMLVLGGYLGEMKIKEVFSDLAAWKCSGVRLIIIPIATIFVLKLFLSDYENISRALLISASASIGTNVAIYAQRLNLDYRYAARIVCLSTILSIVTMPVIMIIFDKV